MSENLPEPRQIPDPPNLPALPAESPEVGRLISPRRIFDELRLDSAPHRPERVRAFVGYQIDNMYRWRRLVCH